ncbi:MAG: tetratricopeptide repeat protein [Bacteroidales bacterium]|nr:MAG: tetratricopeptide repeat protein [Bacteroidales bacterium]
MKNLVILPITLIFTCTTVAQDIPSLVLQGNRQYVEGEYEKAIMTYESIIDSGYEAADLYYNLGNSYFKSHKITSAIINYERAILLSPNDADIKYNLEMARTFVTDKIEVLPLPFFTQWHNRIVRLFSSDLWAIMSMSGFILFLIFFSLYLFVSEYRVKRYSFWLGLLFFFLSVSSFVFSFHHKKIITGHNTAIVFAPSVTVKSSPDDSGTDLFLIHEGTRVRIEDTLGIWTEIKLDDGNKGWLLTSEIVKI